MNEKAGVQEGRSTRDPVRLLFSGSKSNTAAVEIVLKLGCQKSVNFEYKNEDISKSVCSFDSGSIFHPSLGQDISRNRFVVSIYAF